MIRFRIPEKIGGPKNVQFSPHHPQQRTFSMAAEM